MAPYPKKTLSERLLDIDRRVIFAFLFMVMLIPVIHPLQIPVAINTPTRQYYTEIAKLQPGDIVVVESDMSSGNYAVLGIQMVDTFNQLARLNVKIVITTFGTPEGPSLAVLGVSTSDMRNEKYGVDYVILPYVTGEESALAQFLKDIRSVVSADIYGTPIGNLQIMSDINTWKDIKLWIAFIGGGSWAGFDGVVRQLSPYKVPLLAGWFGVLLAGYLPYYTSGIVLGYLNDIRGAAEYELLLGQPGGGVRATDPIATAYLTLLAFMVLGNILVFSKRRTKKGED